MDEPVLTMENFQNKTCIQTALNTAWKNKLDTSLKSFQNIFYFIARVLFPTLPYPYCCTQSLQGYGADSILQQNR